MKKPLVTVVIPTYNRSQLLHYTLLSLQNQRIDKSLFEVIVVDDGSTDDTLQVVRAFEPAFSVRYYYQEDKGYRVASARNMGIAQANGEVILFIDSGIVLGADCLEAHATEHLSESRDLAVIGCVFGFEEEVSDWALALDDLAAPDRIISSYLHNRQNLDAREPIFAKCHDNLMELPAPWAFFWTGNASVKKSSLGQVGAFDTNFDTRWGVEDVELGYRLYHAGAHFRLSRAAMAIHPPHESHTLKKRKQEYYNKLYFANKYKNIETKLFLSCNAFEFNDKLTAATCSIGNT